MLPSISEITESENEKPKKSKNKGNNSDLNYSKPRSQNIDSEPADYGMCLPKKKRDKEKFQIVTEILMTKATKKRSVEDSNWDEYCKSYVNAYILPRRTGYNTNEFEIRLEL